MQNDAVSPQGVIDDLADQVKRLSIDNAVLRTAIKQMQQQQAQQVLQFKIIYLKMQLL